MTLSFSDVNFLIVILGGVIYMLVGGLWYSPLLFGNLWLSFMGKRQEDIQAEPTRYIYTFIAALVTSFFLALFAAAVGADELVEGVEVGVLVWLGFAATTSLIYSAFEGPPYKAWALYSGYQLVCMVIIGALTTL